jgi:hypothetical protein
MHLAGAGASILEQRRLANPGFASQQEHPAARTPRAFQERTDTVALLTAPVEHRAILPAATIC